MFSLKNTPFFKRPSTIFHNSFHTNRLLNNSFDLSPFKLIPQSNLYATIKIYGRPYLVTKGDELTIPFNMKDLKVGEVIKFDEVLNIGSKDLVFYPKNDVEKINITGTILEKTKSKGYEELKTYKRNRKNRRSLVKPPKTVIRISDLSLKLD